MESKLGTEGFVVVAIYILCLLAIGWFSSAKVKNLADFVVAGRSMNRWQIGLSILATWVSGTTILAFPAMGYTNGLAIYFFGSGASLASGLWVGFYVIPQMRKAKIMTVPQMLERWFGPQHRIAAIVAVWARELAYVGSSLVSIGLCISYITPLNYAQAVVVGAGVTVVYMLLGGQRAVILTDLLQNIIIVVLTVFMVSQSMRALGGWEAFTSQLATSHKSFTSGYPLPNLVAWLVMGMFQALPYQALVQRGLSAKNAKEAEAGFLIGGALGAAWYVLLPLLGMLGYAFYGHGENASDIFLQLASREFPPLVYAILVVMLLGAVMSTLDSVLMSVSSNFVVDIYQRFIKPNCSSRESVAASRISVLLALGVGILFAFVFPVMLELLWVGTRIMVAGVAPVVAAVFLYEPVRRAPKTVLSAMLIGMASTVLTFLATGGSGADVVYLWELDPIYVGLSLNIAALTIGTRLETRKAQTRPETVSAGAIEAEVGAREPMLAAANPTKKQVRDETKTGKEREMDFGVPRFNPYLAMAIILGVQFVYYLLWIWALNP